ncbi:hypothetical protein GCM10009836_41250 [Pseudonocardia ailaonensis]|uniref:DUF3710 domain-containing protein n=1 Tax=Pseudonocardia ailaonensis TaxID=367279 RepID=A0ABN2NAA9_9PSEU
MSVRYDDELSEMSDDLEEYDETYEGPDFGPFDVAKLDPAMTDALARRDFGAVQVPVPPRGSVVDPEDGVPIQAIHIAMPNGRLSLSALAAPRSASLWPDLCAEIEESLREGGAQVRSFTGEWGRELHAKTADAQSVFVGIDGERWMVYGVATAPAAEVVALDVELRRMLRGTIVVRGKSPYPPRTVLPLNPPSAAGIVQDEVAATEAAPPKTTLTLRTRAVAKEEPAEDAAPAVAAPAPVAPAPAAARAPVRPVPPVGQGSAPQAPPQAPGHVPADRAPLPQAPAAQGGFPQAPAAHGGFSQAPAIQGGASPAPAGFAHGPGGQVPGGVGQGGPGPYGPPPAVAGQGPRGPQPGGPQLGGPQLGGPQLGGPQHGGSQSGGWQSGGSQSGGPQSGGWQAGAPQVGGPRANGLQTGGPQAGGPQPGGGQLGGGQLGGGQLGGGQSMSGPGAPVRPAAGPGGFGVQEPAPPVGETRMLPAVGASGPAVPPAYGTDEPGRPVPAPYGTEESGRPVPPAYGVDAPGRQDPVALGGQDVGGRAPAAFAGGPTTPGVSRPSQDAYPPAPGYEVVDRDSGRLPLYGYSEQAAPAAPSYGGDPSGYTVVPSGPDTPEDVPTSLFDALMAEQADDRAADRPGPGGVPRGRHYRPGQGGSHRAGSNGHGPNGHPGHGANGHGANGYGANGYGSANGYISNGHSSANGETSANGYGSNGYGANTYGADPVEPARHGGGPDSRPALAYLDVDPMSLFSQPRRGRHRRPEGE